MKPESVNACSTNETQAAITRPLRHAQRKSNVNFKCSNCQRRFPSILRLRRHLNLVHRGAGKLLWCSKCSIAFNEVSAFVQHSRVHHHREKPHADIRSSAVTHDKFPPFHSDTCVFGGGELQDDGNVQNEKSITSGIGKIGSGDPVPDVTDASTNEHSSKEYNVLAENASVLSDVITHEAITVTVTQSDAGQMRGVSERNDETSLRDSPKANHSDSINFTTKSQQQPSIGFDHDGTSTSFLHGHPTMATIGTAKSPFHSAPDADKVQRPVASTVTKGAPKIPKLQRTEAGGMPQQNKLQMHSQGMDLPLNSVADNLNINVPSNIQTINLMAETRNNVLQERLERSETLMYLRSVTAKLDAIIRHFNVPFSEVGSTLLTPPLRTMPMQNMRPTNDMELESQSDPLPFNLPQRLPRKRSPPPHLDCNGANSPVLQRPPVDAFQSKPSDDNAVKLESGLPFSSARFGDEPLYNTDGIVLPEEVIRDLHSKSLNRGNFAKHLVFQLFFPDERKGKNCFGRRAGLQSGPKAPLDPVRLQYVREKVFQYYPCEPGLEETIWRRQCVIAVDTALRGENRPHKKLM